MSIPKYTLEEKALAFDRLWEGCGDGAGELMNWRTVIEPTDPLDSNHSEILRVPVYHFTIAADGDFNYFKDVLHKLATS